MARSLRDRARGRLGAAFSRVEAGVWKVESLVEGGPAARGGVRVGDRLTRVGEWPAGGEELDFLAGLLRPVAGEPLKLTVIRDGEAIRVGVTPR